MFTDSAKAELRRRSEIARKNAGTVLKQWDRLRVSKCSGTKRWITFESWDGHWIVSRSGIDDYSPSAVDRHNEHVVDFTLQSEPLFSIG